MAEQGAMAAGIPGIDVAYVAHLARLQLTEGEIREFQGQLNQIVRYVDDMKAVDVTGVEPMAHSIAIQNVFRPDEPRPGLDRESVLANLPLHDGEQVLVPKIV